MLDNETRDHFVELRAQGKSFAAIAEELNVSKPTLIAWSEDLEVEIANLRQIHVEGLREKHRMGAERRVELFGKQLDAIEGELGKRDLTAVPTERLFDLLVKLGKELNATDAPLRFSKKVGGLHVDLSSTITWEA